MTDAQQRRVGNSRLHYDKATRSIREFRKRWFCVLRTHWLVDHAVYEAPRGTWRCKHCGVALSNLRSSGAAPEQRTEET